MTTLEDKGNVSDGYHTFNELYDHRNLLFIALCKAYKDLAWCAIDHHDGTRYDGHLIVGIDLPSGTITYHLPMGLHGLMNGIKMIPRLPSGMDILRRMLSKGSVTFALFAIRVRKICSKKKLKKKKFKFLIKVA